MLGVGRNETDHVYVDVDGTLLSEPNEHGVYGVNWRLVAKLKKWMAAGGKVVIWTMGGVHHAEMARGLCGLEGAICVAKPDLMIDDASAKFFWKKHRIVLPDEFDF